MNSSECEVGGSRYCLQPQPVSNVGLNVMLEWVKTISVVSEIEVIILEIGE